MKVRIEKARLAFPTLFNAKAFQDGGQPKFSGTFLIDPGSDNVKRIKKAMKQVAKDKWGAKGEKMYAALYKKDRTCLRDGNDKSQDGFEDMLYVSASSSSRPSVFDRDRTPLSAEDGRIYAGCYVNATVNMWAQDNQYGKRINAELSGVQFAKDGDAFSGSAPASADDFEDLSEGADDDFDDDIEDIDDIDDIDDDDFDEDIPF